MMPTSAKDIIAMIIGATLSQ